MPGIDIIVPLNNLLCLAFDLLPNSRKRTIQKIEQVCYH
jgi:hypothetical protein